MLGEIVQRAAGATLPEIMQRRIFGPLAMSATDINDVDDARITTCYHHATSEDTRFQLERAGIPVRDEPTVDGHNIRGAFTSDFNRAMRAAGGVQSTLPDMLKYASALLRRGAGIVQPATFDAMIALEVRPDPRLVNWGPRSPARRSGRRRTAVTMAHVHRPRRRLLRRLELAHRCAARRAPGDRAAHEHHPRRPGAVYRRIHQACSASKTRRSPWTNRPAVLATAPGIYELPMPGSLTNFRPQSRVGRINIAAEDGRLVLTSRWGDWKRGVALVPCDPEDPTFFAVPTESGTSYLALTRDPAGNATGLRFDDLVYMPRRTTDTNSNAWPPVPHAPPAFASSASLVGKGPGVTVSLPSPSLLICAHLCHLWLFLPS